MPLLAKTCFWTVSLSLHAYRLIATAVAARMECFAVLVVNVKTVNGMPTVRMWKTLWKRGTADLVG